MRIGPDCNRPAALASLPSLLAIGGAFFLPFVRGCDALISPLQFSIENAERPIALVWVLPRFAVAALLAVLTIVLVARRREPDRKSEWLAWAGLTASAAALGADWWMILREGGGRHPIAWSWILGIGAATVAATGLLLGAWRHRSWARWEHFIAAHAALSSPLCGVVLTAGSWSAVGIGGYAYVIAIVFLAGIFVLGQRRQRRILSRFST